MKPRFKPNLGWKEFITLFVPQRNKVIQFEKEFAKSFSAVDAVAFPYGRSAQWAFFKAVGIENSEIIMPAYTCSVVAHAVSLSGNTPRFIDINLEDYNMNLDLLAGSINSQTRAIIATHTFGYPQDIDRLESIVKFAEEKYGHKIWLMQDCCHAFGAEWNGRMIGTSGDVAVYAFNISKLMTSIFGGMLTFQDKNLAQIVRKWRDNEYSKPTLLKSILRRLYLIAIFIAFNEKIYGLTWWLQEYTSMLDRFTKAYHLDDLIRFPPDYQDLMLEIEASIGLIQLKKYPEIIKNRVLKVKEYHNSLERKNGWVFPNLVDGATYSHYTVRVPNKEEVMREYAKSGIQLGELIQYSIPELEEYKKLDQKCPNSLIASKSCINFPL